MARTATLAPTKVEVEEAMQKAIFALIKVGELLRCAEYVERRAGRAVKFLRLLLGGGGVDAEWMAPSDWFPKSQDFIARRGLFTLGEIKPRNDESRKTIGRLRNRSAQLFGKSENARDASPVQSSRDQRRNYRLALCNTNDVETN